MIICQFLLCANVHLLSLNSHIFIRVGNTEREFSVLPQAAQQMDHTGFGTMSVGPQSPFFNHWVIPLPSTIKYE